MEGTRPIVMNMEGTPPPAGASPTQPYKCGQNVKIKVNVNPSRRDDRPRSPVSSAQSNAAPPLTIAGDRDGRPYGDRVVGATLAVARL